MADPVVDNADFAVDELRRKARRRLVGAIVLALAAATLLPLLLEQEQKPLGDDVSVRIPPVDGGTFVTRLGVQAPQDAAPGAKSGGAPVSPGDEKVAPPRATEPATEPTPGASAAGASTPGAPAEISAAPASAPAAAPVAGASETKTGSASGEQAPAQSAPPTNPALALAGTSAPSSGGATPAQGAAAPSGAKAEGYVVQLGAFTDTYGASALARKLKKIGYPAFTEPIATSRGTLWRVRVGGYPTREAALDARNKLKADGHDGVVVTAAK
jgi:DedD protein